MSSRDIPALTSCRPRRLARSSACPVAAGARPRAVGADAAPVRAPPASSTRASSTCSRSSCTRARSPRTATTSTTRRRRCSSACSAAACPTGSLPGALWESRIHPEDMAAFEQFNRRQLDGEEAELTYRLIGLDGVTRILWDRARPQQRADGSVLVRGIISDITMRQEADAPARRGERAVHQRCSTSSGEHVYLALAHPDGRFEELFQGPGADRLLGGADPDAEMANWEAAVHPEDRSAYDAFLRQMRRRGGRRRGVPADRRRRDHPLGPRPRRHPPAARRHDRDQRHRLRRHGAAAHARRARPGACGAVARGRGDGRPPLHAPGRPARRLRRGLPRPQPGRARGRIAARRSRGRAGLGVAPAPARPRAPSRGRRAPPGGEPDQARVPRGRPRRPRAHRAREPAPAPRGRRHAVLRRRGARHHRAAPAGGRAAAQHGRAGAGAQRRRAARTDGRADRGVQPPPLRGDRGAGDGRRRDRMGPADPRRRSLQAGQRRPRTRRRRRGARRARAPPGSLPRSRRLPRPLGRGGVRRAAPRRRFRGGARSPGPAPADRRRVRARSRPAASACA